MDLALEDPGTEILGLSRSAERAELFHPHRRHGGDRYSFRQLDVNTDSDQIIAALDEFEPQYIVNFAAQGEVGHSWVHPEQWFQTNAVAIARIGNALAGKSYLKRFMQISTPEVYGSTKSAVTESAGYDPSTPYAASKAAGDLFLSTLAKHRDFPLVTIRATNVYGPCQQLYRIMPRSVIYMKSDRMIQLHGGGAAVKSWIHIRDVSRGELAAMEHGRDGHVYHLSPDHQYSVREVVQRICKIMGNDFSKVTEDVLDRMGQDDAYTVDSSKARAEFGWEPQIDLDQGLTEVVQWIDENWEIIQRESLDYTYRP